jgi:hypothetical protein
MNRGVLWVRPGDLGDRSRDDDLEARVEERGTVVAGSALSSQRHSFSRWIGVITGVAVLKEPTNGRLPSAIAMSLPLARSDYRHSRN